VSTLDAFMRRSVVVNLHSGDAVAGVLWDEQEPWLVLKQASAHEKGGGRSAPIDGEALVHVAQIEFIQALPERDLI
jgi:hypothetical protein